MNYVFGPVPSRRLGKSLGIDPIPLKTCNWNCVYCQLGRTRPLTNIRRDYIPRRAILDEVKSALSAHKPGEIDWITFVGSGEPTLHGGLGWLIRRVKALSNIPVAVITNGALLYLAEIRGELAAADAVLPSLDAGRPELYRKINRPWPKLTFELLLEGLITFKKEYQGKLWIEVMLIKGVNDTEVELTHIAKALDKIQPDEIHLLQPTRPPVETWVKPPDIQSLLRAQAILGTKSRIMLPTNGTFELSGNEPLLEAIISIITRHPMREEEIIKTLEHFSPNDVMTMLDRLKNCGKAQVVERLNTRFWIASPAYFPPVKIE
jgi:wyosine [tRNA(Phe)-imidazoG37] synthetase (radical SAM superfamily)